MPIIDISMLVSSLPLHINAIHINTEVKLPQSTLMYLVCSYTIEWSEKC